MSFGLLSMEDCKAALELDPHVPRSRLKLGVPFVGKDVPSRSSEFAHPDVIIGLTVLAYRYHHIYIAIYCRSKISAAQHLHGYSDSSHPPILKCYF